MEREGKIQKIYPLSPTQEGILFHSLLDKKSRAYFHQMSLNVDGALDVELFDKSFSILVQRHDILRTVFVYEKVKRPRQVVLKERPAGIYFESISHLSEIQKAAFIEEFKKKDREKGFDLSSDLLMRISVLQTAGSSYKVIWSFNHIIMDGWCLGVMVNELLKIYQALRSNVVLDLGEVHPYSNYIAWLEKQDKEQALWYWRKYLEGYEHQATPIPMGKPAEAGEYALEGISFTIDSASTRELEKLAKNTQVTISTILQALWGMLLQKYNNADDVVFGLVVSGRSPEVPGIEKMVGLFINTIPVRIKSSHDTTFSDLSKEIQKNALKSGKYHFASLAETQTHTALKQDLISHIMVIQNTPLDEGVKNLDFGEEIGFTISGVETFEMTNYDFNIVAYPSEELFIKIGYNALVYDGTLVRKAEGHLKALIRSVITYPVIPLHDMEILTPEETRQLLFGCNDTKTSYPRDRTIHERFCEQARKTPDKIAVSCEDRLLTYRELDEKSNQLARFLMKLGARRNHVVALMMNRSVEVIVGLLGILKSGGAYLPIDPEYPPERIRHMLEQCAVDTLLTESSLLGKVNEFGDALERMKAIVSLDARNGIQNVETKPAITCFDVSDIAGHSKSQPVCVNLCSDHAYVIFTSGTTGKPKGVVNSHRSICNLVEWCARELRLQEDEHVCQFASFSFDVSVAEIFPSLVNGFHLHIIPSHKRTLTALLQALHDLKITTLSLPPSLFYHLITLLNDENASLLSSLRLVILGGEALRADQVHKWQAVAGGNVRLLNVYGPTETTVLSTAYWVANPVDQSRAVVLLGKPIANTQIYILDRHLRLSPWGVCGEICIGGEGLADGYLNEPERTKEAFLPNPFSEVPGERIYRTGDLGRMLPDGNIEFVGRIDRQVKIRGFRVELGEIEAVLSQHPAIREAAVITREDKPGLEQLVAYFVPKPEHEPNPIEQNSHLLPDGSESANLRHFLKTKLPDYMVPATFVRIDRIPLTPNGKVDRSALPAPELEKAFVAPVTPMEERLAGILAEVLDLQKVSIDDDFFNDLGGHSLKAMQVLARIHDQITAQMQLKDIFAKPTVAELAKYLDDLLKADQSKQTVEIPSLPKQQDYELSHAQQRLWVLYKLNPKDPYYGIPSNMRITGNLNVAALEEALNCMMRRHSSLRTCFIEREGKPRQVVLDEVDFKLDFQDLSEAMPERQKELIREQVFDDLRTPFDLFKGPLIRVKLFRLNPSEYHFYMKIHHIIADGWSLVVLAQELAESYSALNEGRQPDLTPLRIQYVDYAEWQNRLLLSDTIRKQKEYWLGQFSGRIPVLSMYTDYPRPPIKSTKGDRINFQIDRELTERLNRLATEQKATLFMVLLAAYNALLSQHSDQDDIVVGCPVAGRYHKSLEKVIGMFVNTLAIRNHPERNKSFREFLAEVKENTVKAFENQDYQFEELVNALNISRDADRNPLFDTMFVLQNLDVPQIKFDSLEFMPQELEYRTSPFDLSLGGSESGGTISFTLRYCTALFRHETAEKYVRHFKKILEQAVANPEIKLRDIELLTAEEKIIRDKRCRYAAIERAERKECYPASPLQQRIFVLDRLAGVSTVYNLPEVFIVEGELDKQRLEKALQYLIQRHESLRTSFAMAEEGLVQRIHKDVKFSMPYMEAKEPEIEKIVKDFVAPFDLSQPPLFRTGLVRLSQQKHLWMLDIHQIISECAANGIFISELFDLYEGRRLPTLRIQYKDFCEWQRDLFKAGHFKRQEEYWLKRFSGKIPILHMPTDRPRPAVQNFESNRIEFALEERLTAELKRIETRRETTLFVILLALYNILLSKYTGQEDIIVGSSLEGRWCPDLAYIIGRFTNTLALRNYPQRTRSFLEFLDEVKESTLQALDNSDYPFETLLQRLRLKGDLSRNPLFDAMFVFQRDGRDVPGPEASHLRFSRHKFNHTEAGCDLRLEACERNNRACFRLDYSAALFTKTSMERFADRLVMIAKLVAENHDIEIGAIAF